MRRGEQIGVLAHLLQGQDVERVQRQVGGDDLLRLCLPGRIIEPSARQRRWPPAGRPSSLRRSLLKYSIRIAISISTLPTSVYRKNLMAAYSFRGPPQMPIRKYIGSSITSQNT